MNSLYKKIPLLTIILLSFNEFFGQVPETVSPAFESIFSQFSNVRDFAMSPSADEIFFTILSPLEDISVIAFVKKSGISWTKPEIISFSGTYRDLEPFISPDGLKLYFSSDRPLSDTVQQKRDFDIWYLTRENRQKEWSKPINIGSPINSDLDEFYPSVANNGNIYFTGERSDSKGKDDIYMSIWNGNSFSKPFSLSDSINSNGYEFNSCIAPDESFIVFSGYNRDDGSGSGDLYISYRKKDNSWSCSRNLGANINSRQMDYCPFVDLNSKTLYFTSKRSNVKAKNFKSIDDLQNELNIYQNGFSRIYKVPLKSIL
jgi:hypothetical protein